MIAILEAKLTAHPLVSIVVPVFNSAHLVRNGIRSFCDQSVADIEIIIVDNCSTDDLLDVIRQFEDDRIVYVRNDSNIGMINNFNRGLMLARGKYVTLISSDEMMLGSESLQRRVRLLEGDSEVDFVWCAFDNLLPDGSSYAWDQQLPDREIMPAQDALALLLGGNAKGFRITTVIMRRSILVANGYRIPLVHSGDMIMGAEWLLWSRNAACVRDVIHRNIVHTQHHHDLFGRKAPYLGERDWLMLGLIDRHRARLIALGMPIMKFETIIVGRLLRVIFVQISRQEFYQFNYYLSFAVWRVLQIALKALLTIPNGLLFAVARLASVGWIATRRRLSRVNVLRRLAGRSPLS